MFITSTQLPPPAWQPPASLARPGAGQLALLRVPVPGGPAAAALAELAERVLPPAELARAGRYLHPADGLRFRVARVALRVVLGRCLGVAPAAIELGSGANKKPFLLNDPGLHFSLAHTRDWVLLGLAGQALGVDVERVDPNFAYADVLEVSFGPAERAALARAPDARREFYRLWTRKEALVKATGQGIDDTLPTLPVLDGQHPLPGPAGPGWRIGSFAVAPDHPAAVAYPAGPADWQLLFYELPAAFLLTALAPPAGH